MNRPPASANALQNGVVIRLRETAGNGSTLANRLLKCSEERPTCAQCLKANRECVPSSGITFRHQQNPSLNGDNAGLKSFYGYKETFNSETVWVDIPRNLTFVHTSDPYNDPGLEDSDVPSSPSAHADVGQAGHAAPAGYEAAQRQNESSRDYGYALSSAAYADYATHGLEALSAVASQDAYSYATPAPAARMTGQERSCSHSQPQLSASSSPRGCLIAPSQNLDFILNPASATPFSPASNIDPRLHTSVQLPPILPHHGMYSAAPERPQTGGKQAAHPCIEGAELAFLLRHYSESPGLWMDLFDLEMFFMSAVPVLAAKCPLLLYSCVALSAKQLGRIGGRKPVFNGMIASSRQGRTEIWHDVLTADDWVRKGREYYDLAVSLLRQALQGSTSRPVISSLPADTLPGSISTAQGFPLPTTDSDELVAAIAVLCVYEFLDVSGHEWSRHLDGAKSLFDIANDRMVPLTLPPSPVSPAAQVTRRLVGDAMSSDSNSQNRERYRNGLSKGRLAVFWNICRQDMLSAFINNTSTRLDTSDLPMWRAAGLKLDSQGFVQPSIEPEEVEPMTDDLISNALIWILMKLVNFIAAGDEVPPELCPHGLGIRQQELLEYWHGLDRQLAVWYEGLPASFHATAKRKDDGSGQYEEHWFPRPMCASTMQSYHFARIQLLHNKPHISTASSGRHSLQSSGNPLGGAPGLAVRHASYVQILQQSRHHAREIVAIGNCRSEEGVRVHSVQPLWTAGLVLGVSDAEEGGEVGDEVRELRERVLALLRGVERDMGWATAYRVESLLEIWGLPESWGEADIVGS